MSKTTKMSNLGAILDEFFVGWAEANRHQQRAAAQRAATDQFIVKVEVKEFMNNDRNESAYKAVYTEGKPLDDYLRIVPSKPFFYGQKIVVTVVHSDDHDLIKDRATFTTYDWERKNGMTYEELSNFMIDQIDSLVDQHEQHPRALQVVYTTDHTEELYEFITDLFNGLLTNTSTAIHVIESDWFEPYREGFRLYSNAWYERRTRFCLNCEAPTPPGDKCNASGCDTRWCITCCLVNHN